LAEEIAMNQRALVWAAAILLACTAGRGAAQAPGLSEIKVGQDDGDLRGSDHRVLQAAVDRVAHLGGGTVHVGPGRYLMRNALTLRDNVHVKGVPGKTVLVACAGVVARLAVDGDCNERQICLDDPAGFQVGDGVAVKDERAANGFMVTTATLTARIDARTFKISHPLYLDYMMANKATARLAFPIVGAWHVKNASVDGLTIDGNKTSTQRLDGCRGGGIYLFECANIVIRNCTVRDYHGDGISFQVSSHVVVEDCLVEGCVNLGLHPGSGSHRPILRRNKSRGNGEDGLFVCWRVQGGLFEDNDVRGNKRFGVSIGHRDSDNLFRNNAFIDNARAGVYFRNEAEPMGAHRNVFENNRILDNALSASGTPTSACVVIQGHHHGLVFRDNHIGYTRPTSAAVGVSASRHAQGLDAENNRFENVTTPLQREK
jgi:parallel beta-helix repeat protein